jgi:futalosine hydrolase
MKVVITAATDVELNSIKGKMNDLFINGSTNLKISFHTSGVGMLSAGYSMAKLIFEDKPDLLIEAGIAGSFDSAVTLGKVVVVKEELIGDMGVEEDEIFIDFFDMKLSNGNDFPYINKKLINPWLPQFNLLRLEEVTGLTINQISSDKKRIDQLRTKYNPLIESMEGAALHYVCLQTNVAFIQVRAISNYVGERDKDKWELTKALENLGNTIVKYIDKLAEK